MHGPIDERHDAAREQADAIAQLAFRGIDLPTRQERSGQIGQEAFGVSKRPWQQTARLDEAAQAGPLVDEERAKQRAEPHRIRQHFLEGNASKQALAPGQRRALVQLGAACLHDAAKVDAARTDALAVATHQAELEVLAVRRVGLDASLVQRLNQVDASARRFGLIARQQVGRAVLQA